MRSNEALGSNVVGLRERRAGSGVRLAVARTMPSAGTWWLRRDGVARQITLAGVLVGRSPRCDIVVPSRHVSRCQALIYLTEKGPELEVLGRAKTKVRGDVVARVAPLAPGDRIELPGSTLEIGWDAHDVVTASLRAVRLEFLPRGGRLRFEWRSGEERDVYLADRRCDLVAALLQPPAPYAPGDFLGDELLLGRIWQGGLAGRTNLNVLVHRVRKDLARAGLAEHLIERSEGGGATRFVLAPDTRVDVE